MLGHFLIHRSGVSHPGNAADKSPFDAPEAAGFCGMLASVNEINPGCFVSRACSIAKLAYASPSHCEGNDGNIRYYGASGT
jgi:hypothetical protein